MKNFNQCLTENHEEFVSPRLARKIVAKLLKDNKIRSGQAQDIFFKLSQTVGIKRLFHIAKRLGI